ncbi:iron ABC transporter permease [Micromonospora sp. B11E3]|uniref:FecCD family ABC transporter permease n=1 Tax=Micromonospora sp. B11E3 TaxID=3153562 RepID=UPI00325D80E0
MTLDTRAAAPAATTPAGARTRRAPRSAVWVALCIAATLAGTIAFGLWSLTLGDYPISVPDVARAVVGAGHRADVLVIQQWRLPRVLAALLAGAAFAGSGALLQSLLRNPLASPDVIGVNMGATVVAVAAIIVGLPGVLVPGGALLGAVAAAALLVALAWRNGIGADRLVLVGIGLHTALYAAKTFLILRFPDDVVQGAVLWTVGTLYNRTWAEVAVAACALALLVPAALLLLRLLAVLDLGDDLAAGLGLRVRVVRIGILAAAVALAAVGVGLGGPLPFVALAVPFLARLVAGPLSPRTLVLAVVLGAAVLLVADVAAQHALPTALPAGVVTASVGAPLFFWLLWRHHRGKART